MCQLGSEHDNVGMPSKVAVGKKPLHPTSCVLRRKPALVLTLRTKAATPQQAFAIRLLTAVPQGTFPLQSLRASRNSLRSVVGSGSSGETEPKLLPTPHYNTSIIQAR